MTLKFETIFVPNSTIRLKVKPGAKQNSIDGFVDIDGYNYLKISIKQDPEKGKANDEIIKFLSSLIKVPKSKIQIASGKKTQYKIIKILP
ncbi:MAG: DUF167 domain-containing protein [Rickettsiales bacterium]|nr:DUF167 domain-containing protein [Rickettsiales bacterium]MCA0254851.1 DUF167 domain-containing protein [Pseudomonadota bacterium]